MFGNIGTAIRAGSMLTGGTSPNATGTNVMASSNPAGGLFGLYGGLSGGFSQPSSGGAALAFSRPNMSPMQPTGNVSGSGAITSMLHSSGLPQQPPNGVNPQLWQSVLSHLQSTNFGRSGGVGMMPPSQQRWRPLPSMMPRPLVADPGIAMNTGNFKPQPYLGPIGAGQAI